MRKLTDLIMDNIADALSAKLTFMVFCIIAGLPLLFQLPHDILGWQSYLSQTLIQLVALNVLAVVAKKEGREQKKMLQETHDAVMEELKLGRNQRLAMQQELKMVKNLVKLSKDERKALLELAARLNQGKEGTE